MDEVLSVLEPWYFVAVVVVSNWRGGSNEIKRYSAINRSYCIIHTFEFHQTLLKYLRTFLYENAVMMVGLTDQSDYSICHFVVRLSIHINSRGVLIKNWREENVGSVDIFGVVKCHILSKFRCLAECPFFWGGLCREIPIFHSFYRQFQKNNCQCGAWTKLRRLFITEI